MNPAAADGRLTMHVKVHSSQKVYYDEPAESLSGINASGPFDILPKHHNFITLLSAGEMVIRRGGQAADTRIKISGGLMHVKADQVTVFLDV